MDELIDQGRFSGAHMTLVPRVLELLKQNDQEDVMVFVGGIIPKADEAELQALGVTSVYGPGTATKTIIEDLNKAVQERRTS